MKHYKKTKYCYTNLYHLNTTHLNPTHNLHIKSIEVVTERLDKNEKKKTKKKHSRSIFFRPHVSTVNPQKCEDNTTPRKCTDPNRPCSYSVNFKSHFAAGSTNDILNASRNTELSEIPNSSSMTRCSFPFP